MGRYLELAKQKGPRVDNPPTPSSRALADGVQNLPSRPNDPSAAPRGFTWPSASREAERRFGSGAPKLYPFLGCKVRTTSGVGQLVQVFRDRATVVLNTGEQVFVRIEDVFPERMM